MRRTLLRTRGRFLRRMRRSRKTSHTTKRAYSYVRSRYRFRRNVFFRRLRRQSYVRRRKQRTLTLNSAVIQIPEFYIVKSARRPVPKKSGWDMEATLCLLLESLREEAVGGSLNLESMNNLTSASHLNSAKGEIRLTFGPAEPSNREYCRFRK